MNQQLISIVIIVLSLVISLLFYKVSNFLKPKGVLLFIIGFVALYLRIFLLKEIQISWYTEKNILASILILGIPAVIFSIVSFAKKGFQRREYFFTLLPLYIFFGALQQLFFLAVFTDSVFVLTNNIYVTFISGVSFFFIFHLGWDKQELRKFYPLLILFGILNIGVYLFLRNIIPQLIIHGIVGSILYSSFSNTNQVYRRLKS